MKHTLLLLALLTPAAFALDSSNDEYLGASIDYVRHGLKLNNDALPGGKSQDNTTVGYSLKAGFYSSPNLSWELEYANAGKASQYYRSPNAADDHLEMSQQSVSLSAIGHLPLNDKFGLYGRLGVARLTGRATLDLPSSNASGSLKATATVPVIGIGVEAKFDNNWRGFAELIQTKKLNFSENTDWSELTHSVRRFSTGLAYHY